MATVAMNSQGLVDYIDNDSDSSRLDYRDSGEIFVDPDNIDEATPNSTFRFGPVDFLISASYSLAYESNIRFLNRSLVTGTQSDDIVHTVGPQLQMTVLDPRLPRLALQASYSPLYIAYTDQSNFNNWAHTLNLNAVYSLEQSALSASQSWSRNQQPTADVGGQRISENWASSLSWDWSISEKTQYRAGFTYTTQSLAAGSGFAGNDTDVWNHSQWLGYQILPKLFLGPEVGVRYSENALGVSFWSEFVNLRAEYVPSEKLSLGAFGGVQLSQFNQGGDNTALNYGGDVTWRPFFRTSLGLNFSEQEQVTLIGNARSQITRFVRFNLNQVLVGGVNVGVNLGYNQTDFQGILGQSARTDDGWTAGLAGSYNFSWGLQTGLFYNYIVNNSSSALNDFDNHRVGLRFQYTF